MQKLEQMAVISMALDAVSDSFIKEKDAEGMTIFAAAVELSFRKAFKNSLKMHFAECGDVNCITGALERQSKIFEADVKKALNDFAKQKDLELPWPVEGSDVNAKLREEIMEGIQKARENAHRRK